LLATRFENNFKADISLNQNELDQHVLPLSVQMLIENAIKHNVVSRNHPLHITIGYEKDKLFVRNNLQPKTSDYSTGKGLDNLKRRYSLLGAGEVEIVADTINYTVYLPVIPNKEYASLDY
jgi:LytS/YehU family sensor histidine kinase